MAPQTTDVQSEKGERRPGRTETVAGYDSLMLQISQLREEFEVKFSATRREVRESGEETRREMHALQLEVTTRVDAAAEIHQETRREIHTLTQQAIRRLDILAEAHEDTCRQLRGLHEDLVGRLALVHDAMPKARGSCKLPPLGSVTHTR